MHNGNLLNSRKAKNSATLVAKPQYRLQNRTCVFSIVSEYLKLQISEPQHKIGLTTVSNILNISFDSNRPKFLWYLKILDSALIACLDSISFVLYQANLGLKYMPRYL